VSLLASDPAAPAPEHEDDVSELLQRMRAGDRAAAAQFVFCYGSRIRRRIRGKLGPAMRRVFDSQEILSTLGRRLDRVVRCGRVEAASEEELWALVFRIADNAVNEKARTFRRLQSAEVEDGALARERYARQVGRTNSSEHDVAIDIGSAMGCLTDSVDQQILSHWLAGSRLHAIAMRVGLAEAAVRKRWVKIRLRLQARLGAEVIK
jgi:DNA-directed RNA polymerase specialized sigma24 family protein